jgi:hypothetical protein
VVTVTRSREQASAGISVIEIMAMMSLMLVMMGVAVMNLKKLDNPLQNGAAQLGGFFKQVRAEAISSTSAYIVVPSSSRRLITRRGTKCSDLSPVDDPRVTLNLPSGASLVATNWTLCFNSRGLPDANLQVQLRDLGGQLKTVEVMLGGAVRTN